MHKVGKHRLVKAWPKSQVLNPLIQVGSFIISVERVNIISLQFDNTASILSAKSYQD